MDSLSALVPRPGPLELSGAHILIVDDDQDIRDMLAVALTRVGATTAVAGSVEDALLAFDRRRPDVLVSDLAMPERDGHALIRMLRSLPPGEGGDVLAIAISGHGEAARVQAMASGFDGYLQKPFDVPDLVATIRAHKQAARTTRMPHVPPPAPSPLSAEERIRALEDAVRARDEFISTLGHELRNPLSPIFLQLHVLRDRLRASADGMVRASEIQGGVDGVLRRCKRLLDTMNRILDASAISGGRLSLVLEDVDMAEVARSVCVDRERELHLARSELRFVAPAPVVGRWDRVRLEQVVENLVSNAMRYGAGGPIEVSVTGTDVDGRLVVRDHGPGIAPEDVERIFGQFERAMRRTKAGSFGIGLWVVRGICEAMRGTIRVESRAGEGATFIVTLPRRTPGEDAS